MHTPHESQPHQKPNAGFALVIALSLMAFVLLLTISMTTLVQVESVNAASTKDILQARETAHLGIQLALGNLQRYAGQDQRITANAAVLDSDPTTADIIDGIQAGASAWTGVWDTQALPKHFSDPSSPELTTTQAKLDQTLTWLVSGQNPSPSPDQAIVDPISLGNFSYQSFPVATPGGISTISEIQAPKVKIQPNTHGGQSAAYAYWVQDAASAASIITKQTDTTGSSIPTNNNRTLDNLTEKQLPRYFPIELLPPFDPALNLDDYLERLYSPEQVQMLGTFPTPPIDVIPATAAVLSNPENNELKKDLSALMRGEPTTASWKTEPLWTAADINAAISPLPPTAPDYSIFENWISAVDSSANAAIRTGNYGTNEEVITPPMHPVIARVQLFIQVTPYDVPTTAPTPPATQVPPKLRLHVYPSVILWNPYDVPLQTSGYGVEIDCKVDLQVTEIYVNGGSFPTLRGFPGSNDEGADINQIYPQNIINFYADSDLLDQNALIFRLKDVAIQPGECLVFSPSNYEDLSLAAIRGKDWANANELTYEPPFNQFNSFQVNTSVQLETNQSGDQWHLLSPATPGVARVYHRYATINGARTSDQTIEAKLYSLSTNNGELLQEVSDLVWVEHQDSNDPPEAKYAPAWNSAFYEIDAPEPNLPQGKGHIFYHKTGTVQFQSDDERSAHGELIAPFADANPWATRSTRTPGFADTRNLSWGGVVANQSQNWFVPDTDTSDPDRLRGFTGAIYRLIDLTGSSPGPGNHYLAAHQPTDADDLISLGALQHLPLTSKNYFPAFAIGRPAAFAGDYIDLANRAVWDGLYLTGETFSTGERPFANDRLEILSGATPGVLDDPANLIQRGTLNINSTYPRAWLATLAAQYGFQVNLESNTLLTGYSGTTQTAANATPFLHSMRPASGPELNAQADSPASWRGHRQLVEDSNPTGTQQLTRLAEQIAQGVRARGPFRSMADFVNSGVLQDAIDTTALQINADFGDQMIETPGYISQADLLQSLAPALNYRSDTFRIRSYGESRDINNKLQASVICEAIVQRIPETLPPFGRRFKIIQLNYLDPADL